MPKTILKDQRSTTSFNFQFDLYNYFSYTITLQENIFIRIAQKYVTSGEENDFQKKGGRKEKLLHEKIYQCTWSCWFSCRSVVLVKLKEPGSVAYINISWRLVVLVKLKEPGSADYINISWRLVVLVKLNEPGSADYINISWRLVVLVKLNEPCSDAYINISWRSVVLVKLEEPGSAVCINIS